VTARSIVSGAALFVFALAVGCAPRATSPSSPGTLYEAQGPVRVAERRYTDDEGNTMTLRFDGAEKGRSVQAQATDRDGKPLAVVEIPMKELTVCLPRAGASSAAGSEPKPLCQPLVFVTDGAFVKMGTATCTCTVIGGILYCYGSTCH